VFPRLRFFLTGLLLWSTVAAADSSVTTHASADRSFTTTPLMSNETRTLVQMLEYYHYN